MADAIQIAGPNGAGKTTFARQYLRVHHPEGTFLNADEIQRSEPRFAHPIAAERELLRRLAIAESSGETFAVETTLASLRYVRRLRAWSGLGYLTTVHFIELPSAEFAISRVASRVAAGGHPVPDEDVRRRFRRGRELFRSTFKALPDEWCHWKSDEGGMRLVDEGQN